MATLRILAGQTLVCVVFCATLGASQLDEYGLKSAYLFNFLQFVEWTPSRLPDRAPLVVCVFDRSPITEKLASLSGQFVKNHPLQVRTVTQPAEVAGCHALFVPVARANRIADLVARHPGAGVLFVGEEPNAPRPDAVISLVTADNRLVFDINLEAARDQQLTVSSKLLRLARRVLDDPRGGG